MAAFYLHKHYATGCYQKTRFQFSSSSEERRIRKRRAKYKERLLGYSGEWTTAFTLTSGVAEERKNPKEMMACAKKYMKATNVDFGICLDVDLDGNWHIHGLASDSFDLHEWAEVHCCNADALYCSPLYFPGTDEDAKEEALMRYVNYMLQNVGKIPKGLHGCATSYIPQKAKTEIYDEDGNLVYSNCNKGVCRREENQAPETVHSAACNSYESPDLPVADEQIHPQKESTLKYNCKLFRTRTVEIHAPDRKAVVLKRTEEAFRQQGLQKKLKDGKTFHISRYKKKTITRMGRGPPAQRSGPCRNKSRKSNNVQQAIIAQKILFMDRICSCSEIQKNS